MGLLMFITICFISIQGTFTYDNCPRTWKKIGCFHDQIFPDRPLKNELLNIRDRYSNHFDRNAPLDWNNYPKSLLSLACKCFKLSRERNHRFFGLQFYGECWTGERSYQFSRDGPSTHCIGVDYQPCVDSDKSECIGKAYTNYIYDTQATVPIDSPENPVDGGWSDWSEWSTCSKSCEGGVHDRYRECTNPTPRHGGKTCEGEGEVQEACNEEKCAQDCKSQLDITLAVDASTSIGTKNFKLIKSFILKLTQHYSVTKDSVHFGEIIFARKPYPFFKVSDETYWDQAALETKISQTYYFKGKTSTGMMLQMADKDYFCSTCSRAGVPKVLIVITDGKSTDEDEKLLPKMIKTLKENRVTIISVGIGNSIDEEELNLMAKNEDHVILVKDFKYLVETMNKILDLSCQANVFAARN